MYATIPSYHLTKKKCRTLWHFTSILVVMSHKYNACSVFALQAYPPAAFVCVAPCPRNQLNAKNTDVTLHKQSANEKQYM